MRLVGALLAVLLVAACSSVEPPGPQSAITRTDDRSSRAALLSATLHDDPGSGCLWVTAPSGPSQVAITKIHLYRDYVAQWPGGVIHLYEEGHLVGKEGDEVSFGGGVVSDESALAGCPAPAKDLFSAGG